MLQLGFCCCDHEAQTCFRLVSKGLFFHLDESTELRSRQSKCSGEPIDERQHLSLANFESNCLTVLVFVSP